jgi:hypothetical protein
VPLAEFDDALQQAGKLIVHGAMLPLVRCGLLPGRKRESRNFTALYDFHCSAHLILLPSSSCKHYDRPVIGAFGLWQLRPSYTTSMRQSN